MRKISTADKKRFFEMVEAIKELRREIEKFRGYNDPGYPQHRERVKKALDRVLELERKFLSDSIRQECLSPLRYGYGDIAEAFLQLKDLKRALLYACAYLEINRIAEDTEGVKAAYKVLSDVAVVAGNSDAFKRFWKKSGKKKDEVYQIVLRNLQNRERKLAVSENCREKPPSFYRLAENFPLYVISREMGVSVEAVKRMLNR